MGEKQYEIILSPADWLRVRVLTKRGRAFQFLVQYEALIDDQLHVISRYDNVHGFIHQDTFDPDGKRQRNTLSMWQLRTLRLIGGGIGQDMWKGSDEDEKNRSIWLEKRMLDKSADLITKFWQFLYEHPDFFEDDTNDILVFAPKDDPMFTTADLKRALDEAKERENWGVMVIEVTQDGTTPSFSIARRISPEEVAQSTVGELLVTA